MNKIILQLWEESNAKDGFLSDGCSLHIDSIERNKYISEIYKGRDSSNVPSEYDRIVGEEVIAFVPDKIYDLVEKDGTLKLSEPAFQNLLKFDEIIFNNIEI
jgi:hypothetical protein